MRTYSPAPGCIRKSRFDVHPDTVGRRYKRAKAGGVAAIVVQKRGPKSKPRRLPEQQEQCVIKALRDQIPDQSKLGFTAGLIIKKAINLANTTQPAWTACNLLHIPF